MNYSPYKTKELLQNNNFNFKKKFGQNFIVDSNTIDGIINRADIKEDTLVIEIGPGAGALTYKLCQHAKHVICFEIDETLKPILENNLEGISNVSIIFEDFLKADVESVIKKYEYSKLYIVANLPYYITTPIIVKVIEDNLNVDKLVVMVQKEVGDRFKAKVGTKDYNSLSIFLNYHYDIKKIMDVSRNVFMPMPNVDSIVLELVKKETKYPLVSESHFFKLVKDSFVQKRKTIKNNLSNYDIQVIEKVLKKHNLDLTVRAENIPLELFIEISNELVKNDR